jgi:hypothetical protein
MLAEKMLQFKSPSSKRGAGLYTLLCSYGVLQYSATKKITFFRTARVYAAPVGKEEMDVRSLRVSFTHAWMGRWSRK